jgi:hypothetical protein
MNVKVKRAVMCTLVCMIIADLFGACVFCTCSAQKYISYIESARYGTCSSLECFCAGFSARTFIFS